MTKLLLLALAGCSAGDNLGNTPALGLARWTVPLVGATPQTRANTVAIDPSGDIVASGYFNGTVDFGSGPVGSTSPAGTWTSFVTKRAGADGGERWTVLIGGPRQGRLEIAAVATDHTGAIYIAGTFDGQTNFGGGTVDAADLGTAFITKYAADGTLAWTHGIGKGSTGMVGHLAIAPDDTVLATGGCEFSNQKIVFADRTITCDSTHYPGFIARYGADGSLLWDREVPVGVNKLAVLPDGSAAVSTTISETATIAGTTIVAQSSDTPVVIHVATDGTLDRAATFGQPQLQYDPASLNAISDGSVIAGWNAAMSNQDPDRIPNLAGFDPSGAVAWSAHAVQGPAQIVDATVLADDAVITAGSIDDYVADFGSGAINGDGFLASYAPDGSLLEARPFGDNAGNRAMMVAVSSASDGAVAFVGLAIGSPDFGTGPVAGGTGAMVIGLISPPLP